MASLIVAGSILLHNKIKDKKEAKKEKKRQSYEDRYNELQQEHSQHQEKHLQSQKTGESQPSSNGEAWNDAKRRNSQTSLRSADGDGPTRWVDEAVKSRHKTG